MWGARRRTHHIIIQEEQISEPERDNHKGQRDPHEPRVRGRGEAQRAEESDGDKRHHSAGVAAREIPCSACGVARPAGWWLEAANGERMRSRSEHVCIRACEK